MLEDVVEESKISEGDKAARLVEAGKGQAVALSSGGYRFSVAVVYGDLR